MLLRPSCAIDDGLAISPTLEHRLSIFECNTAGQHLIKLFFLRSGFHSHRFHWAILCNVSYQPRNADRSKSNSSVDDGPSSPLFSDLHMANRVVAIETLHRRSLFFFLALISICCGRTHPKCHSGPQPTACNTHASEISTHGRIRTDQPLSVLEKSFPFPTEWICQRRNLLSMRVSRNANFFFIF